MLLLQVRFGTLKVLQELYTKLGEEMVVLLPETTPYLYELMEGESGSPCPICKLDWLVGAGECLELGGASGCRRGNCIVCCMELKGLQVG